MTYSVSRETFKPYGFGVKSVFGVQYLRQPFVIHTHTHILAS